MGKGFMHERKNILGIDSSDGYRNIVNVLNASELYT